MSTSAETKRGYRAQAVLCRIVGGKQNAPCDIHVNGRGFEVWLSHNGKNSASLREDLARADRHGGYCVQLFGIVPQGNRRKGVRSLGEFLRDVNCTATVVEVRQSINEAQDGNGDVFDEQERLW